MKSNLAVIDILWKDGRYSGETDERIGRTVAYAIRTGVIEDDRKGEVR